MNANFETASVDSVNFPNSEAALIDERIAPSVENQHLVSDQLFAKEPTKSCHQ